MVRGCELRPGVVGGDGNHGGCEWGSDVAMGHWWVSGPLGTAGKEGESRRQRERGAGCGSRPAPSRMSPGPRC